MPPADLDADTPDGCSGVGCPAAGEQAIRATTIAAVVIVAAIAALVSYRHMRAVAIDFGEDRLNATVIPLSVDGLIVAASMAILSETRAERPASRLPYALLILGSAASLAANVMHAHPNTPSRIIAAWPPAALIGAYELLMRQIRRPLAARPFAGTGPSGRRPRTKKEQLRWLLEEQVPAGDERTIAGLARDLAPQIRLHAGTARRYLPELLDDLAAARATPAVVPLSTPPGGPRRRRGRSR